MMIEVFVPVACLFPMGIARPKTHPEYRKMGEWLALIGSIFYSPSCFRRPKGNVKEQEVEVEETTDENPDNSKTTEEVEPNKQVEQPKPIVNNYDDDEDEDFDD